MCHFKLNCGKQINNIIFSHSNMDMLACLVDQTFIIFRYQKSIDAENNAKFSGSFKYETMKALKLENQAVDPLKSYNSSIQHVLWPYENELVLIADWIDSGINLISYEI